VTARYDDEGASSVEFALVLPVLVGLLGVGMFFAWLFFEKAQLGHAAARGARYAAVPLNTGTYAFCSEDVVTELNKHESSGQVTAAEVTVRDRSGAAPNCHATPAQAYRVPQGYVRVRVSHTFQNPFTSIVSAILPTDDTWTVSSSAERRVETP
jgi:Flp pilus assembly protein TadG